MSLHHCHANECLVETPQKDLMCQQHWRMVPQVMQNAVWTHFRRRGVAAKNPTGWAQYSEACANAVEHVAKLEGKNTLNNHRKLMTQFKKIANESFNE